jgi:hypothetical protein
MPFFQERLIFAFFSFFFSGGCPQVSKKADLTRLPRRRARQALPLRGFLLLTGWPFTKNVELQCLSSAFGLACSGAAPPPAAPPKLSARTIPISSGLIRKNAKILKNFLLNSNGRSGCTQLGLLQIVQSGH